MSTPTQVPQTTTIEITINQEQKELICLACEKVGRASESALPGSSW
ncbi:hypothetical protein QUB68_00640 [Microcoleus sp. A006_D1]